jgi:DNA-binding transcriptional ArsR family regulator
MYTDFSAVGKLLAVGARSTMLSAMLEGRALTAGELARLAGVTAATASEHIAALTDGGLATVTKQGRHRYVRLAGPEVAAALEALSQICPAEPVHSLRQSRQAAALQSARTCYDHLAGRLGVAIHDALIDKGFLTTEPYGLTDAAGDGLALFGVDVASLNGRRRALVRPCLDWTERRHHLAGSVAAQLAESMVERRWVVHTDSGRGIRLTPAGGRMLTNHLGLSGDWVSAP